MTLHTLGFHIAVPKLREPYADTDNNIGLTLY
jgi:hypothetical protein